MGALISRFRGKKSTYEILESIEKDVASLQKARKESQDRLRRMVSRLLVWSVLLYVCVAAFGVWCYMTEAWELKALYCVPMLAFPVLIWGLKRLLHWYFVSRIAKNDQALSDLRERKKAMLEDVMETETYKKAKEILERFDPARFKKLENLELSVSTKVSQDHQDRPNPQGTPGTNLQHRAPPRPPQTPMGTPRPRGPVPVRAITPMVRPGVQMAPPTRPGAPMMSTPVRAPGGRGVPPMNTPHTAPMQGYAPPGPPMPRSVLPRDRGAMDKLMDYLVGDGPENRMALICRGCHSHNGMALNEEFDFLSFRCCYCYCLNPARKQRPYAPRMEFFNPRAAPGGKPQPPSKQQSESESESCTDDESVALDKPALPAPVKNDTLGSSSSVEIIDREVMTPDPNHAAQGHMLNDATDPQVKTTVNNDTTTNDGDVAAAVAVIDTYQQLPLSEDAYASDGKDSNYESSEFSEMSEKISDGSEAPPSNEAHDGGADTCGVTVAGDIDGEMVAGDTDGEMVAGDTDGEMVVGDTDGMVVSGDTDGDVTPSEGGHHSASHRELCESQDGVTPTLLEPTTHDTSCSVDDTADLVLPGSTDKAGSAETDGSSESFEMVPNEGSSEKVTEE